MQVVVKRIGKPPFYSPWDSEVVGWWGITVLSSHLTIPLLHHPTIPDKRHPSDLFIYLQSLFSKKNPT